VTYEKLSRGLSQSALAVYRECPYAYKLHYIDKYQPIFWDPSILDVGSYVHEALDRYYRHHFLVHPQDRDDILIETYDELKDVWDKSLTPEQLNKAYTCLENHADWEYKQTQKGIRTKPLTEIKIGRNGFFGILDYVDLTTDTVIDWKTGKYPSLSYNYRMQAAIYKTLYENNFNRKLRNLSFFFLHGNAWRTVGFGKEKQKKVTFDVYDLKNRIAKSYETGEWPKEPRLKSGCKNCQYNYYCHIIKKD